ncbi:MAG: 4Fe-4S dicluster domain-containing protein [Eggerthellaceae bacterium]|nr:4Fe-4S dicluster domain-containing protein [Eggerthellaceae bacterium]
MGNAESLGGGVIHIKMDESVCQGCRTCESVCSLFHTGAVNPTTTGIKIRQPETGVYTANICQQCFDAPCAQACPKGAIVYNEYSYVYEITDDCIGCGKCAKACPFDAIMISDPASGAKKAYKCDLCGGKPQCIEACPRTALSW